ncbi:hypothetical protein LINPERHAP2_LOCUS35864, partial [Linum perenne]
DGVSNARDELQDFEDEVPPIRNAALSNEESIVHENDQHDNNEAMVAKKVRGPNICKTVARFHPGETLPPEFHWNRAVGSNHKAFSRYLGKIVRNNQKKKKKSKNREAKDSCPKQGNPVEKKEEEKKKSDSEEMAKVVWDVEVNVGKSQGPIPSSFRSSVSTLLALSSTKLTDAGVESAIQLKIELHSLVLRLISWVSSHKQCVKSLNGWLVKCLLPDKPTEKQLPAEEEYPPVVCSLREMVQQFGCYLRDGSCQCRSVTTGSRKQATGATTCTCLGTGDCR